MDGVEEATWTALEALGAISLPEGQAALALARAVDSGKSLMAAPAMVKELRATLDGLREKTPQAKDGIDDIAARRAARLAGKSKPTDPVPAVDGAVVKRRRVRGPSG